MSLITIFVFLVLVVFFVVFIIWMLRKNKRTEQKLISLENNFNKIEEEKNLIITEKQKAEDKNKKLWQMSETVHKERKLVDEANEKLSFEKEKLEAEKKKLDDKIKKLWSTSTAIHKEKERINELKIEIENKHQEIVDSVNYAQRIQRALLANKKTLDENLHDYFVLFMPKDIVSGDFYWAQKMTDHSFTIVTADSTGHGVPGAIMSILNISCLSEAVNAQNLLLPNEILDYTRKRIMEHMANDGSAEGGKDGMDAIICNFNFNTLELKFTAANNPLWIIRNNALLEFMVDKMPVGKPMGEIHPFTMQQFKLEKNDLVIMITDGFADQFGGDKGKKFMYKKLKDLILSVSNLESHQQHETLKNTFVEWRGRLEQVDDVCIIGIRV